MHAMKLLAAFALVFVVGCAESPTDPATSLAPETALFSHAGAPAGTCLSESWTLLSLDSGDPLLRYDLNGNQHICAKSYEKTVGKKTFSGTEYTDDLLAY